MPVHLKNDDSNPTKAMYEVGVLCDLAAGAWLDGAAAPTKLVNPSLSFRWIFLGTNSACAAGPDFFGGAWLLWKQAGFS